MSRSRACLAPLVALSLLFGCVSSSAQAPKGDAKPQASAGAAGKIGKFPHVSFDTKKRQVRVECESLEVDAPLEFFCVLVNTSEHESVLRTPAKPSHIHTALLAVGLRPGRPVEYSESLKKWLPPQGPPLHVTLEWQKDGRTVSAPAHRCMRDLNTKKEIKPVNWVFCGSRVMENGDYAADTTGYVVSVVNFDLTLIDIGRIASSSNDALELQRNPDVAPPGGTRVTMVIEPAGSAAGGDADKPAPKAEAETPQTDEQREVVRRYFGSAEEKDDAGAISDVTVDVKRMEQLRQRWLGAVRPHANALRDAAQAHYEVINEMRREQQRLIDEADRLQRTIDALEKEYQDLTTPRPAPAE
jgi:hypothetical protein